MIGNMKNANGILKIYIDVQIMDIQLVQLVNYAVGIGLMKNINSIKTNNLWEKGGLK